VKTQKNDRQGTLAKPFSYEGPGLHSGGKQLVVIHPAEAGAGIVFRQINKRGQTTEIPASWRRVRDMPLCTCLTAENGAKVRTIEHLMAAFYGCGVDNAVVEVSGREIPIIDGSASPWVELIQTAGIRRLEQPRRRIVLNKKIEVTDGNRRITIEPSKVLRVRLKTSTKDFGKMVWRGPMKRRVFLKEIAPARTFGRLSQGLAARLLTAVAPNPLCQGASRKTAIVISRGRVLNTEGLRYSDEFVRHRVLDLMGDLMLAGAELVGTITAKSPVHRLNRKLLEAIFADPQAWEEVLT
jgi:UDP-3-O-[3-hydroxymyristoyl] N-acetylglucosamine deacetylase